MMKTLSMVLGLVLLVASPGIVSQAYGCERCLAIVNRIRATRGLPLYRYDPGLTRIAEANAQYRARIGWHGRHLRNQFPPLANQMEGCEGPGYGHDIRAHQFYACTVTTRREYRQGWIYAGAAKVRGPDGRIYCTIRLSRTPVNY